MQKIWHKAYLGKSGPPSSSSSRATYGTEDLSPDLASFLREVNRAMLAKPSSSSSTQPPDLHLQQSHDNHLSTSARISTDSVSCEEEPPVVSLGADTLNGSTYSGCYNLCSSYFMSDDDCYTSIPLNHLTSISERLQIHAAAGDNNNSEIVAVAVRSGADVELNLSGPLLLKDMPSNKYAKEKKHHKAYQRDAMKVITAAAAATDTAMESASSSSGDEASRPAAGVSELETASIDAQQNQHQVVRGHMQEEVDLAGAVRSPDGVAVGVVGDEVTSHSLCATADNGSGTHQGLELLMGDSNSLMSLLNGVDCLESMLRSCSEHCLNDNSVMESVDHSGTTSSSGHQQTMSEMSSSSPPKSLDVINSSPPNTRIGGDWPLPLPSPEGDTILKPSPHQKKKKKKTIRPTRIAASREELCHMSSPFNENPPVNLSHRITADHSSPQITAVSRSDEKEPEPAAVIAGSGGGDSGTGLLSVGLITTAEGKTVSADRNSSCGWSLLDDASFLQREGGSQMMWIDNHSEWTRFQERQAATTPCDMSSADPHLLLLHDISALEAPEGLASSMAHDSQRLLEDEDASLSGNPSVNDASLLFGAFMPDDLMASHSCFSNISKFVGFLKPDCAASGMVGSGADNRRARVDIEEQLLPQLKKQKQQQKLGIFAAVMASSKTPRSASRP